MWFKMDHLPRYSTLSFVTYNTHTKSSNRFVFHVCQRNLRKFTKYLLLVSSRCKSKNCKICTIKKIMLQMLTIMSLMSLRMIYHICKKTMILPVNPFGMCNYVDFQVQLTFCVSCFSIYYY